MTLLLETKRLIIKAPILSDLNNWIAVHADADLKKQSDADIAQWLNYHILEFQQYGFSMCSVFLKENNVFIGRAGLFHYPSVDSKNPDIEMGYIIHKGHQGKGYATELANGLIKFAFDDLKVHKVVALTGVDNKISQRVLEKSGMKYLKKIQIDGEDLLLYEVLTPNASD